MSIVADQKCKMMGCAHDCDKKSIAQRNFEYSMAHQACMLAKIAFLPYTSLKSFYGRRSKAIVKKIG